jgi:hypothetical protein
MEFLIPDHSSQDKPERFYREHELLRNRAVSRKDGRRATPV